MGLMASSAADERDHSMSELALGRRLVIVTFQASTTRRGLDQVLLWRSMGVVAIGTGTQLQCGMCDGGILGKGSDIVVAIQAKARFPIFQYLTSTPLVTGLAVLHHGVQAFRE